MNVCTVTRHCTRLNFSCRLYTAMLMQIWTIICIEKKPHCEWFIETVSHLCVTPDLRGGGQSLQEDCVHSVNCAQQDGCTGLLANRKHGKQCLLFAPEDQNGCWKHFHIRSVRRKKKSFHDIFRLFYELGFIASHCCSCFSFHTFCFLS